MRSYIKFCAGLFKASNLSIPYYEEQLRAAGSDHQLADEFEIWKAEKIALHPFEISFDAVVQWPYYFNLHDKTDLVFLLDTFVEFQYAPPFDTNMQTEIELRLAKIFVTKSPRKKGRKA